MVYEFMTGVGMFRIQQDLDEPEKVLLSIDNIPIGKYDSAESAARAVAGQNTGWERWDTLFNISGPQDLSEWEKT